MIGRWAVLAVGSSALTLIAGVRVAAADEKSPPVAGEPLGTSEPYWLTYAAFRNDVFTDLIPPMDDRGFTHDNVFLLRRRGGPYTFGGGFVHRFITSRIDRRRWDLVELFATAEHAWQPFGDTSVATGSLRVGPNLGGNWGGRYLQNGWHAISKTGPTVDEGLANHYPGDRTYGFVVGSRVRASIGDGARASSGDRAEARIGDGGQASDGAVGVTSRDRLQGYTFVDGQLALGGTGVTQMEAALGGSAASKHFGAHVEIALTRYHVGDPNLALPGAYRTGFQFEWRVGVDVHWSRFRVGYEYRANESGSGEPVGVVEFSSTR